MSEGPLRCACCGETQSREGFVRVNRVPDGSRFKVGDDLRIECALAMGVRLPPERMPRFVGWVAPL